VTRAFRQLGEAGADYQTKDRYIPSRDIRALERRRATGSSAGMSYPRRPLRADSLLRYNARRRHRRRWQGRWRSLLRQFRRRVRRQAAFAMIALDVEEASASRRKPLPIFGAGAYGSPSRKLSLMLWPRRPGAGGRGRRKSLGVTGTPLKAGISRSAFSPSTSSWQVVRSRRNASALTGPGRARRDQAERDLQGLRHQGRRLASRGEDCHSGAGCRRTNCRRAGESSPQTPAGSNPEQRWQSAGRPEDQGDVAPLPSNQRARRRQPPRPASTAWHPAGDDGGGGDGQGWDVKQRVGRGCFSVLRHGYNYASA